MDNSRIKEIVEILMDTDIYFDLSLIERYSLIKDISNKYLSPDSSLMKVFNLNEDKYTDNASLPRRLCYKGV